MDFENLPSPLYQCEGCHILIFSSFGIILIPLIIKIAFCFFFFEEQYL